MKRLTPLKAIRAKCLDCSGFEKDKVKECPFDGNLDSLCPLYPLRMGKGSRATLKKIRTHCLECCNGQSIEVKLCPAVRCALWEYRFGKRPQKGQFWSKNRTTEGVLEPVGQKMGKDLDQHAKHQFGE